VSNMDQPKEDTLVPTADSTNNVFARDVSGNKSDAAVTTVGVTKSLMAYLKGAINQLASILTGQTDMKGTGFVKDTHSLKNLKDLIDAVKTAQTFMHKPTIAFSQVAPVADQEYVILDTTANVRIVQITASCTNTAPPNYIDVKVTIDGVDEHLYRNNPATVTDYFGAFTADSGSSGTFSFNGTVTNALARAFLTEGRSVKVTMLYHGGTVSLIKCQLSYAQR
jgi:hypothetical protein